MPTNPDYQGPSDPNALWVIIIAILLLVVVPQLF
jgi:hypothetical protein